MRIRSGETNYLHLLALLVEIKDDPALPWHSYPCLEWDRVVNGGKRGGYGTVKTPAGYEKAHRLSWSLVNGPIPPGIMILHHCDNRRCIRPVHLFSGTALDNARDMAAKGRDHRIGPPSERAHFVKLSSENVVQIRQILKQNGLPQRAIAGQFKVTQSCISGIACGRTWKMTA